MTNYNVENPEITPVETTNTKPLYSIVCPEQLIEFTTLYFDIEPVKDCVFWCQGINDTYKITTESTQYMLRVYRYNWRTREDILFELDALNYIEQFAITSYIAKMIPIHQCITHHGSNDNLTKNIFINLDNSSNVTLPTVVASEGIRYMMMTEWANGSELDFSDATSIDLYSKTLAQLHHDTQYFKSKSPRAELDLSHLLFESLETLLPYALKHSDRDWFLHLVDSLDKSISGLFKTEDNFGFCHGDYNGVNVHISDREAALFDFDCCGLGYRVYDLATFKWACLTNGSDLTVWDSFLTGYLKYRNLTESEQAVIDEFVMVRQIWVMALHCKTALAKGWLTSRYFTYQFGLLKEWQQKNFTTCQYHY